MTEKLQGRSKPPCRTQGMREFFPAPLGCAECVVRAPGTVSICNVNLARNAPAPIPNPFPHGKCSPGSKNPQLWWGHGRGRQKNLLKMDWIGTSWKRGKVEFGELQFG